jgi:hypothetical protein
MGEDGLGARGRRRQLVSIINGSFFDGRRCPRVLRLRRTPCTPRRKPLCRLAHQKNCSFLNWTLTPVLTLFMGICG